MAAKAIDVYIEVIDHTPDGDAVNIHYRGIVANGPLSRSNMHHTTQHDLGARAPAKVRAVAGDDYWGDAEAKAELSDHLGECGFLVNIVPNPSAVQQLDAANATRAHEKKRTAKLSRKKPAN